MEMLSAVNRKDRCSNHFLGACGAVFQLAEKIDSKSIKCGFKSHRRYLYVEVDNK